MVIEDLIQLETFWDDKSKWADTWPTIVPAQLRLFLKEASIFRKKYGMVDGLYARESFSFDDFFKDAQLLTQSFSPEERDCASAFLREVTRTWAMGKLSHFVGNESVIPMLLLIVGGGQKRDLAMVGQLANNIFLPRGAAKVQRQCIERIISGPTGK